MMKQLGQPSFIGQDRRARLQKAAFCAIVSAFSLVYLAGCGSGLPGDQLTGSSSSVLDANMGVNSLSADGSLKVEPQAAGDYVAKRLLVKFRDVTDTEINDALGAAQAHVAGEIPGIGVKIVELPPQASETAQMRAFRQRPEVVFAELDVVVPPDATPDDPYYANEWHLATVGANAAWDFTTGSNSVIIAILDTGMDLSHPELGPKAVAGWNFNDNNSDNSDVNGHGTAVAGAAAAASNNAVGVASLAWNCLIMPIRISDANGSASYSAAANALIWAADHGARVANISYMMSDSSTVASAAQYFENRTGGGVVTVSAGNYSTFDSSPDNPYVLTISATDATDSVASWSNTGNNIDLAAPGTNIYTTTPGGGFGSGSGTSFSAPVVAGAAALVLSVNPGLTGPEVQDILMRSADDLGPAGWDAQYGWGRLNAAQAVAMAVDYTGGASDVQPPSVAIVSPAAGATVGGMVTLSVAASDDVAVASVSLSVDGTLLETDTAAPFDFSWDTTSLPDAPHTIRADATDTTGNTASSSMTVTTSNVPDTTPPTIQITTPADGARVRGTVAVTSAVADDVSVVQVELYVDGVFQDSSTDWPFTTKWMTRKVPRGLHDLQCKAYDAAGNVGISETVTVKR